jgi:hypothetical protein
MKDAPGPSTLLAAQIEPPCASITTRLIVRPRPMHAARVTIPAARSTKVCHLAMAQADDSRRRRHALPQSGWPACLPLKSRIPAVDGHERRGARFSSVGAGHNRGGPARPRLRGLGVKVIVSAPSPRRLGPGCRDNGKLLCLAPPRRDNELWSWSELARSIVSVRHPDRAAPAMTRLPKGPHAL